MKLTDLIEARVGLPSDRRKHLSAQRSKLMQRLRQAGLDVRIPFDAVVDGEPVSVLAVLDRTVVFERHGSRHVATLEHVEVDRVDRVEFIEHRDQRLGAGERSRANARTIMRWRRTPRRHVSEAQRRGGWD